MKNICIYKRKDGRYEGRVYLGKNDNGRRIYKSYYGSSTEEIIQKYKRKFVSDEQTTEITAMTVKALSKEWFRYIINRIKKSTAANYEMKLKKHILPAFGAKDCIQLTRNDIYDFIERSEKSGLSSRYIGDILVLLKSVLKFGAKEYGLKNVVDKIVIPKKHKKDVRLLNEIEQTILKKHIERSCGTTELGIAMSLNMGLRIGELCALQWNDIDLEKRILTVRKTIQRVHFSDEGQRTRLIVTAPKSERSNRLIPIPECLAEKLRNAKRAGDEYVISAKTTPTEPRTVQYRFAKLLKELSLPSVHFHSLRHAFATKAIELGFDIKTLSEILGHSSIELTMNLYVHSSLARKRACMDLIK